MAFMKTSIALNKTQVVKNSQNELVQFHTISKLSSEEIVALLQRYKKGEDIGFVPTPDLLKKYGF